MNSTEIDNRAKQLVDEMTIKELALRIIELEEKSRSLESEVKLLLKSHFNSGNK